MALKALSRSQSVSRAFLGLLIDKQLIKPGFRGILSDKSLSEIESYLVEKRVLTKEQLSRAFAQFYRLPYGRLVDRPIMPEVVSLFSEETIRHYKSMPFSLDGLNLYLAIGDPAKLESNAPEAINRLRKEKGFHINLVIVPEADIEAVLKKIHFSPEVSTIPQAPVSGMPNQPKPIANNGGQVSLPASPVAPPATPPLVNRTAQNADLGEKTIDLREVEIPQKALNKIPLSVAKRYQMIVFKSADPGSQFEPPRISVAMVDPDDIHVKEILTYIEQKNRVVIDRYSTDEASFKSGLSQYQAGSKQESKPESSASQPAATEPNVAKENNTEDKLPGEIETQKPAQQAVASPVVTSENTQATTGTAASVYQDGLPEVNKQASSPKLPPPDMSRQILTLSPEEIVNKPESESPTEIQKIVKEQQLSNEEQNLDTLLRAPIQSVEDLAKVFRGGMIPEIVAATLFLAIRMEASDVHIEAEQKIDRIRYRIDGILHDVIQFPHSMHASLISRIKILAKMKIDEQRIPQDGRFDVIIDNRQVDLRVSTLPTVHGEKIVMRLLDKTAGIISLERLGLTGSAFERVINNISKPYGILLSTGPTGSGKSTTLYAILSRISKPGVNIITLEDPVEYELPGINQAQVKPQIGFTFADGLRSVLRQDPNVIMVGEVRDLETAAMATHAALTGHLVLTTLHTNDASGALPRLIDMGVEPFLITSSINAVIGQRLVRKICEHCKEQVEIPAPVMAFIKQKLSDIPQGELKNVDLENMVFYRGKGCPYCTNGYKGRIGIFEVLVMSEPLEALAIKRAPTSEIKQVAIKEGMVTMTQDGLVKALKGITTVDEVLRVTTTEIKEVPEGGQ